MNKKEIAQQFTRQMLDPEQQDPQTLIAELKFQIARLTEKIEKIVNGHNLSLLHSSGKFLEDQIRDNKELATKLRQEIEQARVTFRKQNRGSIWNRYWTAIVVGIIASLITNLIWILRS